MRLQFLSLFSLLAGAIASPVNNKNASSLQSSSHSPMLKAALIRAPPALCSEPILSREYHGVDINATASLELWFPGYPRGNNATWINRWANSYVANSIIRGDNNWNRLVTAAKRNAVYVAFGFSEKQGNYIYMAQALLNPNGEVLIHRLKLRPSGGERDIWSDGTTAELNVVGTEYGRIGMLECWEHFHPSMTFPVQAQAEAIHISSWPYMSDYGSSANGAEAYETAEVNMAAASVYAANSGAWVLVAVVGRAAAFSPSGLEVKHVDASVSYDEEPYLMVSVNTTGFVGRKGSDVDGEQSWGVLEEIRDGWPSEVPKVKGNFTNRVLNDINSF